MADESLRAEAKVSDSSALAVSDGYGMPAYPEFDERPSQVWDEMEYDHRDEYEPTGAGANVETFEVSPLLPHSMFYSSSFE